MQNRKYTTYQSKQHVMRCFYDFLSKQIFFPLKEQYYWIHSFKKEAIQNGSSEIATSRQKVTTLVRAMDLVSPMPEISTTSEKIF